MRQLRALLIALAVTGGPPALCQEQPLSLGRAFELAMTANRDLAAARLSREVARSGIEVARQRPNPELTLEAERETPREACTVALPIETAGKRRHRVELAEAAAGGSEAGVADLEARTRVAVRRAYYTLAAAQRRVAEMEEVVHLARRTRDATGQRYDSGDAPRLDLVQAEVTLSQADNDLSAAAAERDAARAGLNTLLAWPPDRPTVVETDLSAGEIPPLQAAIDRAMSSSADLALADRRIAEARARVDLARAERAPDLVLQGAVTRRAEPEFDTGWRAGLSIVLPILSRHRAEVEVEERALDRLRAEREAVSERIRGEVTAAHTLATARRERYLRYCDVILPQTEQLERMATDAYHSGQTGLVAMLQSFASVRDVRLRSLQSGLDYQMALGDLESAMGAPLP